MPPRRSCASWEWSLRGAVVGLAIGRNGRSGGAGRSGSSRRSGRAGVGRRLVGLNRDAARILPATTDTAPPVRPGETTRRCTRAKTPSSTTASTATRMAPPAVCRVVAQGEAVDEVAAQAAEPDVRRHRRGRHHLQHRRAQPGHAAAASPHGHLDLAQHLARRHAHAPAPRRAPPAAPPRCRRRCRRAAAGWRAGRAPGCSASVNARSLWIIGPEPQRRRQQQARGSARPRTELASDDQPAQPPGVTDPQPERDRDQRPRAARAIAVYSRCCERAVGDAVLALPVGRVGEPRRDRGDHARAPCTRSHGVTSRVPSDDDGVERQRQQHAGHDAGEQLAPDDPVEAVDEQVAELADADEGGDADDADVAHRGHPQPGGDRPARRAAARPRTAAGPPCSPWRSPPARCRRARR